MCSSWQCCGPECSSHDGKKTEQTHCGIFQKDFGVHHESSESSEHKQTVLDKQQWPATPEN